MNLTSITKIKFVTGNDNINTFLNIEELGYFIMQAWFGLEMDDLIRWMINLANFCLKTHM